MTPQRGTRDVQLASHGVNSTLDTAAMVGPSGSTPPDAAHVEVTDVSVSYDGAANAVYKASLRVPQGSTVALLGPSGCGKTSLLRAIAGLERPTTGTITIDGTRVSGPRTWVAPQRRHVGMVFQDGALFPHLTVADNIAFGLKAPGVALTATERAARVAELLDLVDLGDLDDRLPETLSGGQQQRVALARSLAPRPSVLLLDEPFSALDAGLRVQVRSDVGRILREIGVTTIFVTHDQDEAFVLGDQVVVMREGRIEQVGSPDALYRTPTNPWVAAFVGEANFVRGHIGDSITSTATHGDDPTVAGRAQTLLGPIPLRSHDAFDDGADLTVLVRPEQISLREGDCAEIVAVEYYGHDVRYELRLDEGSTLAARTKATAVRARGDRVCVRFNGTTAEAWPIGDDARASTPSAAC